MDGNSDSVDALVQRHLSLMFPRCPFRPMASLLVMVRSKYHSSDTETINTRCTVVISQAFGQVGGTAHVVHPPCHGATLRVRPVQSMARRALS